ncbi:S13-like H2TH domain-containing protein [Gonapodya prolifera JEL478]|uniref:S13-like H2TH domain-containing protein n=1 Tax=Gonapodya prolifera (strain JEL478) TaxID=1344416 RepID=A0A139AA89_GONPJ|nr:S13-like H2TH domain-containing protein [Gonapodya prolifera JEL478]|eukprot:KXS13415.1 S13-like H2TH domain-containing protein [Gonapodya prolifera JEL478]
MFLLGVNVPDGKLARVALTHIYGIGASQADAICARLAIHRHCLLRDVPEDTLNRLSAELNARLLESDLKREVRRRIEAEVAIGSQRGHMHERGLPTKGQRTQTNARTAKRRNAGRLQGRLYSTSAYHPSTPYPTLTDGVTERWASSLEGLVGFGKRLFLGR